MYIVGFVCLAIALVLYALIVRAPKEGVEPNYADSTEGSVSLFEVVKSPSLWVISLAGATFGIAVGIFAGWIPSYWNFTGIMDLISGNQVVGWIYLGEALACIFAGFLLNRVKRRKRFAAIVSILYAIVLFAAYHTTTYAGAMAVSATRCRRNRLLHDVQQSRHDGRCSAGWCYSRRNGDDRLDLPLVHRWRVLGYLCCRLLVHEGLRPERRGCRIAIAS